MKYLNEVYKKMRKRFKILLVPSLAFYSIAIGGPADTVLDNNKSLKNISEIKDVVFTNLGIEQKNVVHSIKIGTKTTIKKSIIKNRAYMRGSNVKNIGKEQENNIGSVNFGNE